jgi:hypothetical protein
MKVRLKKIDDAGAGRWASTDNRFVIEGHISCISPVGERFYCLRDRVTGERFNDRETLAECRDTINWIVESESANDLFKE